jgi:hypothetical protein
VFEVGGGVADEKVVDDYVDERCKGASLFYSGYS